MKTPDEIKKGLDVCIGEDERCAKCSYVCYGDCRTALEVDALKYIQQLERERDAAVDMEFSHCDFVGIFSESEVIGNIHDNPELIQEVE